LGLFKKKLKFHMHSLSQYSTYTYNNNICYYIVYECNMSIKMV